MYTPVNHIKVEFKGVKIIYVCFLHDVIYPPVYTG